ncbi:MAG TPA: DUF885 domain-containing protein [Acidimicrobiales bacterium]
MSLSDRLADAAADSSDRPIGERLHALFDTLWDYRLETQPEFATYLGEPGPVHRWSDMSRDAFEQRKRDAEISLDALAGIDPSGLDDVDRTSLRLATYEHEQAVRLGRFPHELLAVTTMFGPQVDIPMVLSLMAPRTIGDVENLVARLHGVPVFVDQVIGLLDDGRDEGVTIPRVVAEQLPPAAASLGDAGDVASSGFLVALGDRPDGIAADDWEELVADARAAVTDAAAPAFRRFAAYLESTYAPACRETTAMADLPDGAEWYAELVRQQTTTDLSPEEIHAIGVDEVARIRKQMDEVIAASGHVGDFASFAEFLRTDDRFYFDDPHELLAAYRDMAKRADAELPRLFGLLPRLTYGIREVPDHEAPTAPMAYYLPGSLESARPGWFYANTYDLRARPRYEMEATCLHEAVPGHHLQIALAAELEGLPKFRSKSLEYNAFAEGWGLYAESLGDDMGFYRDPYSKFGQLSSELWRAIRLVVDTGMHALGWERQRAIDYCLENSTAAMHDVQTEIDRYLSIPAQALSYKVGELTIRRLRHEATAAAGAAFDLRAFHDLVIGAGGLPLEVLEERVRAWAAS